MFWDRQWREHGTCSPFKQLPYFELAMRLIKSIHLQDVLEQKCGIRPSNTMFYDTMYFFNITSNLSTIPQIIWSGISPPELKEIRLCFTKNVYGDFIDCPFTYKIRGCRNSFRWPLM